MKINKKSIFVIISVIYLSLSYSLYIILRYETVASLVKEDGVIEWIGSFSLLIASIICIYLFFKSDSGNKVFRFETKRNIFFLLLGILFFVAFGEEISWGQRIFGIQTPDFLIGSNIQEETNIHNLDFTYKTIWGKELNYTLLLFDLFWVTFCLIIPILNKYNEKFFRFFKVINLPIVPIWIGSLFFVNYLVEKLYYKLNLINVLFTFEEIRETNFEMLFLIVAIYFLHSQKNKTKQLVSVGS